MINNENYFVPNRKNLINIESNETLFKFLDVSRTVLDVMSGQSDEYFTKYKFSGNYPVEYVSQRTLKPFVVEPNPKFFDHRCPAIENISLSSGYLSEIDRSWIFFDNTVYFWNPSSPKNLHVCYPIDVQVEEIFIIPISLGELIVENSNNVFNFIIVFNAPNMVKFCSASLLYDEETDSSDFFVRISSQFVLRNKFTLTSLRYTNDSRTFFGASNQNIYELKYFLKDSNLTCNLIDITSHSLLYFIPSLVVNIMEANTIIKIECSQNILYAMDSKFNIHIFQLNNRFERLSKMDTLKFTTIDKQCSQIIGKINFFQTSTIICMHVCSDSESQFVQLIIVFSNGFRAYITSMNSKDNKLTSYTLKFHVVHLRKPPFDDISEIKNTYSVFFNHNNFIICTSYGNEYRLWCSSKSLRCNSDFFQEYITIYSLERPITMLYERRINNIIFPTPFLIESCITPKPETAVQLEDLFKFNNIIGILSEIESVDIHIKKCYQTLLSIYQMKNYSETKEFSSYTSQSTDIEFNLACFTILGKVKLNEEEIALNILGDLWESGCYSEVHFINGMIYKRNGVNDRNSKEENFGYKALHADFKNFPLLEFDILQSKPVSLLLYSFIIHINSHLSPIWNSRILLFKEDKIWKPSINLHDIKIFHNSIDELLLCFKRLITFYKCKFNNPTFIEKRLFLKDIQIDFNSDLKTIERLEHISVLTYQWLYIWMGIIAVEPDKIFTQQNFINNLRTLNYSEFIFKDIYISDKLTWKFISFIMDKPKIFEFFINKWPLDATLYFNDEFKEIAFANQKLIEATFSKYLDVRNRNLQSCLEIYSKNPLYLDLSWICENLRKINFHPNAITLCLHVSDSLSRYEPVIHEDDVIYYRSTREKIVETVFMILNDSFYKFKNISNTSAWDKPCEHGSDFHSKNFRSTILAALESSKDQSLSVKIFDWVLNNNFSEYLVKSNSLYLHDYLNDVDFDELSFLDLKKTRCLYEIYESDHNFELAALQLYRIATSNIKIQPQDGDLDEYLSLEERIDYLQISLAQISLVSVTQENATLISNIKNRIQLLHLQLKVVEELRAVIKNRNITEMDSFRFALKTISSNILPLKSILKNIVISCELKISYLLLVKVLGRDYADEDYVVKVWNYLFRRLCEIMTSSASKTDQNAFLNKFNDLLEEYYKTDYCFPIQRLILEFSCIVMNTKLKNIFLPELLTKTGILQADEICYIIQENIFQLIGSNIKDYGTVKILFFLMDTYINLCKAILENPSKTTFANTLKMFNDYLQTKTMTLKIDPVDVQQYQNKIYLISDMLMKFYEKL